jgi:DNA-binding LacI/PurR family transcriptional regulator
MIKKTNPTKRLFSAVADEIRRDISADNFDGEIISEKIIMDKYGVSRNTALKSLVVLEGMGWVMRYPGKGTVIVKKKNALKSTVNILLNTETIGMDLFHQRSWTGAEILSAISREAKQSNVNMRIIFLNMDDSIEEKMESLLSLGANNAFVGLFGPPVKDFIPGFTENKMPYLVRTYPHGDFNQICTESKNATKKAVRYLINSYDVKKILFVHPDQGFDMHMKGRLEGYMEALKDCGIPFDEKMLFPFKPYDSGEVMSAKDRLKEILPGIDAVFTCNGASGFETYKVMVDLGVKMPQDIPLIVFDDFEEFEKLSPAISAVRCNYDEIGRQIVRECCDMMRNGFRNDIRIIVNSQLMLRDTA